jgi:hypothetical protein
MAAEQNLNVSLKKKEQTKSLSAVGQLPRLHNNNSIPARQSSTRFRAQAGQ